MRFPERSKSNAVKYIQTVVMKEDTLQNIMWSELGKQRLLANIRSIDHCTEI